jgi:hypothetical protein
MDIFVEKLTSNAVYKINSYALKQETNLTYFMSVILQKTIRDNQRSTWSLGDFSCPFGSAIKPGMFAHGLWSQRP